MRAALIGERDPAGDAHLAPVRVERHLAPRRDDGDLRRPATPERRHAAPIAFAGKLDLFRDVRLAGEHAGAATSPRHAVVIADRLANRQARTGVGGENDIALNAIGSTPLQHANVKVGGEARAAGLQLLAGGLGVAVDD